jgi:hypothetical protein
MEAFIKPYLYRMDLFTDPAIMEAFKAEYGYDLAPATTHEQYMDIAKFFTKYGEDNGLELWGTTNQAHTGHASSTYEYFEQLPRPLAFSTGASTWTPGRHAKPMAVRDEQPDGQGCIAVAC